MLVDRLRLITDQEYPPEAQKIREQLLSISEHVRDELERLLLSGEMVTSDEMLKEDAEVRALRFAKAVRELFSYVRYLRASSPNQSPPAIQATWTHLTNQFFPFEEPLCLVRPQWEYNFKYISFASYLKIVASRALLDPDEKITGPKLDDVLDGIWNNRMKRCGDDHERRYGPTPPKFVSVVSFASLDTHDTLLYPLLAHELGHFIDLSGTPPFHIEGLVKTKVNEMRINARQFLAGKGIEPGRVDEFVSDLVETVLVCIGELLADLIAIRVLGFSFFSALSEFLKTINAKKFSIVTESGHPGVNFRLWVSLSELLNESGENSIVDFLERNSGMSESELLLHYLNEWNKDLEAAVTQIKTGVESSHNSDSPERKLRRLGERTIINVVDDLRRIASSIIPNAKRVALSKSFFNRIARLRNDVPPYLPNDDERSFPEIMSAAWAYQILHGEEKERQLPSLKEKFHEYNKTCMLILKSTELLALPKKLSDPPLAIDVHAEDADDYLKLKGVLSGSALRYRISQVGLEGEEHSEAHLDIVPYFQDSVKGGSLDVHLGNWFVVAKRAKVSNLPVQTKEDSDQLSYKTIGREEIFVRSDDHFLIHPGDLVLGSTLEFFAFPKDLMAFVEGRSGIGRKGLIVATATQVAPGFHGVIVLELVNAGTVPLELKPGDRIAQLVFQTMTDPVSKNDIYKGDYYCQIRP